MRWRQLMVSQSCGVWGGMFPGWEQRVAKALRWKACGASMMASVKELGFCSQCLRSRGVSEVSFSLSGWWDRA